MRRKRRSVTVALASLAVVATPLAAYAGTGNTVDEGCKTTRHDSLCMDPNAGQGVFSEGNVAVYSSQAGQFVYKGRGPWTINYSQGSINCPAGTICQRFFPPVLTAQGSAVAITTRRQGTVFVGNIVAGGGD